MRTKISLNSLKKLGSGIIITMMIFLLDSCSSEITFLPSTVVPAAQGYVKIKKDDNKNFVIQIHITDLAEVERIQPPKQTYVVWLVSNQATNENLGKIESSTGPLSSKLKADFETVSSFKPMKIFITAENDANTKIPGNQIVITTDKIFNK